MNCDVVVIGAGVSGLAVAYDLARTGHDVKVVERQVGVGGNAISERFGGFLMEHGPSTMNAAIDEATDFNRELDLAASSINLGPNVRRRYLLDKGKLHGISTHPLGFIASNYLSLRGRLSIAGEFLKRRKSYAGDESIYEFTARRFGGEFAEKVMDPLAAGLFCGDAKQLSVAAAFPKLVEFEQTYGSITRAVVANRGGSQPGRKLYSWPDGIATLPQRLAQVLTTRVHTSTVVKRLRRGVTGFETETAGGKIRSRAVVLAVQPHVTASLLQDIEPDTAAAVGDISAPPLDVVFLGYEAKQVAHPLDGLGYLSTNSADRVITGAQFCSTMFSGRAPENYVSIAAYTGGTRHPEIAQISEERLAQVIAAELGKLLDIKGEPVVQRVRRWPLGLPQYTAGHGNTVAILENAHQRMPGLFLTGNYLGGVSVANCLKTARGVGRNVDAFLQTKSSPQVIRTARHHGG